MPVLEATTNKTLLIMCTQLLYSWDQNLMKFWSERLSAYKRDTSQYAKGYRDALSECMEELNMQGYPETELLSGIPDSEAREYLKSVEADAWLAESH